MRKLTCLKLCMVEEKAPQIGHQRKVVVIWLAKMAAELNLRKLRCAQILLSLANVNCPHLAARMHIIR